MQDSNSRSFFKGVSWRFFASFTTFILASIFIEKDLIGDIKKGLNSDITVLTANDANCFAFDFCLCMGLVTGPEGV